MMRVKNDSGFSDKKVITSVVTSAGRKSESSEFYYRLVPL